MRQTDRPDKVTIELIILEWSMNMYRILKCYYYFQNIGYVRFAEFCHATCLTFNEWQPLSETQDFSFEGKDKR